MKFTLRLLFQKWIIFLKKLYHQFFKIHHNVSHLAPPPRYVAQKFDNKHSTNAKYILAKIYARSSNPYSIRVKDTFSLFPSFLFFLFPPQCDKVRKLCHFTRSNPVATQLVPHHSVYRAQFIERVATLPSPILGCIANDSSSTRKIIFDWAARALELGRLASNLPSPLPRGW